MYKIVDNFLTFNEMRTIAEPPFNPFAKGWYTEPKKLYQKRILEEASNYIGFSSIVGLEEWHHNPHWSSLPDEHYDKDEALYEETGELQFPLCSCIYYYRIRDLVGGDLVLDNTITITPTENTLVLLEPGLLHNITPYVSGVRLSVNINPWDYQIKTS